MTSKGEGERKSGKHNYRHAAVSALAMQWIGIILRWKEGCP